MRAALLIAGKDIRQRLRDRSAVLMALVVPLVLASIFGLTFHDVTSGGVTFDFAVVDRDRGAIARTFDARALRPLARDGLITVRREPTLAAGRRAANRGDVDATFVLPAGLTASVAGPRPRGIEVIGNVDAPIATQVAQSMAQSFASALDAHRVAAAALGGRTAGDPVSPVAVVDISTASHQLDAGTFYAAGMAVFFLFFTVQFGISTILDERREGTLARLIAAPIHRASVLGGKLLTSLMLGTVSMAVLVLATSLLLGAHWGDPVAVGLLVVAGVIAATAVMALVATVARTTDQAQAWQSMVALVLGLLGGTFFPVAQAGGLIATLSLITPQAWFLRGIENLSDGSGPSAVAGPVAAILVFALVTGALAFRRVGRLVAR